MVEITAKDLFRTRDQHMGCMVAMGKTRDQEYIWLNDISLNVDGMYSICCEYFNTLENEYEELIEYVNPNQMLSLEFQPLVCNILCKM